MLSLWPSWCDIQMLYVNGVTRNVTNYMHFLCTHVSSLVSLDFIYKTQIQRENDLHFETETGRVLNPVWGPFKCWSLYIFTSCTPMEIALPECMKHSVSILVTCLPLELWVIIKTYWFRVVKEMILQEKGRIDSGKINTADVYDRNRRPGGIVCAIFCIHKIQKDIPVQG